ncbi:hypothetical protein BX285_6435 [Streptomyces sp. 1114.5]|uniref:hypothetical protein n=1 Tax=unclassified Streptomyces TaxID=2593676 RepID=UPI000BDC1CB9|nr:MULTISPECIES: hypothetical protein [unclassified Streptomyces]RKT09348.1 hypothetical protein BX285_6435 [Streptomyces sp. 1114.5]SOB88637.1 hypothetical protein SAMN06272789_6926 [Streptomyces sp. 1331.2]
MDTQHMDTEDMLRGALRDEADGLAVGEWTVGPLREHVRRQRRGRRVVTGVSAVVAALAVVAGTGAVLSAQHGPRAVGPAAQAPLVPAEPAPEPVVLEPGQQLPLGRQDWWMQLKDQEICIHDAPSYKTGPGCGGYSWAAGSTGMAMQYLANLPQGEEGLYNLVYHGPGPVARMTVELGGRAYWAAVVTLPGTPGYATGYAWAPSLRATGDPKIYPAEGVRITAYDAQGGVLATKILTS